jgi:hypothetical protein
MESSIVSMTLGFDTHSEPDKRQSSTTPGSAIDQTRLRLSSGKGYSMYLAVARATASP